MTRATAEQLRADLPRLDRDRYDRPCLFWRGLALIIFDGDREAGLFLARLWTEIESHGCDPAHFRPLTEWARRFWVCAIARPGVTSIGCGASFWITESGELQELSVEQRTWVERL